MEIFGWGTDSHGSGVIRLLTNIDDPNVACQSVTERLHAVSPQLIVHDVRPGPFEEVPDDDDAEERRLDAFVARLDPETRREVVSRIMRLHG